MKEIDVAQGSPEWHAHRAKHRNASDAPAMMGESPNLNRSDFVRIVATGDEVAHSRYVEEVVFARGHEIEALTRPLAEALVGDDLFCLTGVSEDGYLSASFDGLSMDGLTGWECKQWNEAKADDVRSDRIPAQDYWQVVQQFAVAEEMQRLLYTVSKDGTAESTVHLWVQRSEIEPAISTLRAGWAQFERDVAEYVPVAAVVAPVVEVVHLPAVSVSVGGAIQIQSNLPEFGVALKDFIARIDMKPETDQAFAEAEAAVKTLSKAQEALEAAKAAGLAQVASVDDMVRTVDSLAELARKTRLALEKMVKSRKDEIRAEIVTTARAAWNQHVNALNDKLGRVLLTVLPPDFAGAMKGKKTITSLRGAVNDMLAKAKIEANQQAELFAGNLAVIDELAKDHQFLVRDLRELVTVNPEHLPGIIKGRIAEHEAKEAARLEAERAKIRAEEEARAQREAERKAEQERQRIREEEQAKARAEAEDRRRAEARESLARAEQRIESTAGEARTMTAVPAAAAVATTKQAPAAAGWPATRAPAPDPFAAPRPTDTEIVHALCARFRASRMEVITWLREMDFSALPVKEAA